MNPMAWKKESQAYPFKPSGDATYAIWQDPSSYDPLTQGPPYLPKFASLSTPPGSELLLLLAFCRALAWLHQNHHWVTSGLNYYGDHLLFERLYDQTAEDIDKLAEKAIGVGCLVELINPVFQARAMISFLQKYPSGSGVMECAQSSFEAEKGFLGYLGKTVETLKGRNVLSRGVDDLLAGIEDKHESHIYLLGQRTNCSPWKSLGG